MELGARRRLEGGGFGKPKPPLFPGDGGRHRQRALRARSSVEDEAATGKQSMTPIQFHPSRRPRSAAQADWIRGITAWVGPVGPPNVLRRRRTGLRATATGADSTRYRVRGTYRPRPGVIPRTPRPTGAAGQRSSARVRAARRRSAPAPLRRPVRRRGGAGPRRSRGRAVGRSRCSGRSPWPGRR